MKKVFTILSAIILLSGLQAQAAPVTSDRALEIAKLIFGAQHATKASYGAVRVVWDGELVATKAAVQPAFYVIARDGGGFVIIAGDDNVRPVLAISENGRFSTEGMPDNVKWWMDRMKKYVRSASAQSAEVRDLWNKYTATKGTPAYITGGVTVVSEHLTPEWDQGNNDLAWGFGENVFNKFCPLQSNQLTITGCVATALAEILTYQSGQYGDQMPAAAVGTVGGYQAVSGFVTPASYELGYAYDWAGMRNVPDMISVKNASSSVRESIGHLMADCGAIVQAQYGVDGTSAVYTYIVSGFAESFGFNKGAHVEHPINYTTAKWQEMLKAELVKRPIYYAGSGHAFVMDGHGTYEGDDVFHINFGWGGSCNGYYYQTYIYDGDVDYNEPNGEALIDFYLDVDGTSTYSPKMTLYASSERHGLQLGAGSVIRPGSGFELVFGRYANEGSGNFSGSTRVLLVDKDRHYKAQVGSWNYSGELQTGWGFSSISIGCNVPSDVTLAFGDKIVLTYQTDESGSIFDWVAFPENGTVVGELPVMPAAVIDVGRYYVGDYFQFHLLNCDYVYAGTVWKITTPSGNVAAWPQSQGEFRLTEPGFYKIVAETRSADGSATIETIVANIMVSGE